MSRAACEGMNPALFFGEQREGRRTAQARVAEAKAICAECSMTLRCLNAAVAYETGQVDGNTHEPTGIWGGLTPAERKGLVQASRCCAECGQPIARTYKRRYCEPCGLVVRRRTKATYERARRMPMASKKEWA